MAEQRTDTELLASFREPATKEKAFTAIIKKYQERLYWHIRRMVVDHEDSNDVMQNVLSGSGMPGKFPGGSASCIPGFTGSPPMKA